MNLLFEAHRGPSTVLALAFPELLPGDSAERLDEVSSDSTTNDMVEKMRAEALRLEELARVRDDGHAEGFAEGEERRRQDLEIERSAVSHLCVSFAKERKRYFAEIETEVVKLALAVAARVLQRESTMDPTLLKGVVKVALARLGDAKGAVLRMHPLDVAAWHDAMKHSGLEIEGDVSMKNGELRLEAVGGVAELGVAAQLVEIERGFFDLMARRPA